MNTPAYQQTAAVEIIRDKRGVIVGRLETQNLTKKTIARDTHGLLVGQYDHRANVTRDARGILVGTGNLLPALVLR
ncbi:hypothetical protein [Methylorubrum extorquens]|uniref:Uncharacterized protein n=1 Tax=Methylorubrum extorquens (strain CM4 / NCIMB 13688) TaxID=440085 RepID=B7KWL2_METC4|nr:hypothetical protein [Methylorubrum extorquens]ACK86089.1 conserved hypothetical protein [Methylorubrum extorquens CM4]